MHCINLFDPLIISEQVSVNAAENCNPVQIISLPQAHPTLTLLSVTSLIYWVVIVIELVTSKLF